MNILRKFLALAIAAGACGAAMAQPSPALAKLKPADFPQQPIEMTVVYPAGGGVDLTARLLGKYAEKASGDRFLVNNRTGGAGMVGHTYLATQAKPDGYTMGVVVNLLWGDAMLRSQGRWTYADLEPIAYINSDPLTWVVNAEGPYKGMSAKQIIQTAKDKPGTVRVATVPGSMWEYLIEQIEKNTGAKFLHVPFQAGGPGVVALLGGSVDVAQGFYGEFRSHMEAGKLTPVALAGNERVPHLKDVPTFNEVFGARDYVWTIIRFAVVPKGTPEARKAYLAAVMRTALQDPGLQGEYQKLGAYFDSTLVKSTNLPKDLDAMAMHEREFYVKTGRLK